MNHLRPAFLRGMRVAVVVLGLLLVANTSGTGSRPAQASSTFSVSNPVCVQAAVTSSICRINIRSIYANDPALLGVTIGINGKLRARMNTFFESSATLDYSMLGNGLNVTCGLPGSGGNPHAGHVYSVTISTVVSSGSPSVDVASVLCPYYQKLTYLPILRK
jgi:hypothetical protein